MYKTQSGRFIAIRNKPQMISRSGAAPTPPSLSRTPEELQSTPMKGSRTLQSLNKHQDSIRKLHKAYMSTSDPHMKKLIGTARDRMLAKVTHESTYHGFIESMIRFNKSLVEMDDELRRLERAHKATPHDDVTFTRYSMAAKRAGKPEPKTPGENKARGRLSTIKKLEKGDRKQTPGRARLRAVGTGRHANATRFALARYHAAARLGIERAKRGMKMASDQNQANSFKEAHDRYKRALQHVKNAKAVHRGRGNVPGNTTGHMSRAHDELRVAHELSGLKKRGTGKKYFPGTEF